MLSLLWHNLLHLGLTVAGGAALVIALHLLERTTSRTVAHHLGWRGVLATGWLGVPLHELSHLLAARLFGHRIIAWRLFDPDPVSGTLDYVRHAHSRRSLWQLGGNLAVGLAPLVAGGLALWGLLAWMTEAAVWGEALRQGRDLMSAREPGAVLGGLGQLATTVAAGVWDGRGPLMPVQVYLAVCVASHMAPSRADLAGALTGVLVLIVGLGAGSAAAAWQGISLAGAPIALVPLALAVVPATAIQATYAAVVHLIARSGSRRRGLSRC